MEKANKVDKKMNWLGHLVNIWFKTEETLSNEELDVLYKIAKAMTLSEVEEKQKETPEEEVIVKRKYNPVRRIRKRKSKKKNTRFIRKYKSYTIKEDSFIFMNYSTLSAGEIGKKLGRTSQAIRVRYGVLRRKYYGN